MSSNELIYKFKNFLKVLDYKILTKFFIKEFEIHPNHIIKITKDNSTTRIKLKNNLNIYIKQYNICILYSKLPYDYKENITDFNIFITEYNIKLSEELIEKWTFEYVI